ncbi:MAG: hypothetical protein KKA67_09650 [Spirochaetes bacterium]|nr:hypothetical protein [Spirochaetota bacterium]MBU1080734.1 hypothetical protein [Spirochaetota bacterium]
MVQFYLLSVILNIVAGYALVSFQTEPKGTKFDGIREYLKDGTLRLVLGILCTAVGFFKLLTVMRGDIPVVGDLVPSLAGMASGFSLLLEFYKTNSNVTTTALEKIDSILVGNRRIVGIVSIVSGVVHFLFANILFL